MKSVIHMTVALTVLAGLCMGCGKSEKPEAPAAEAPKAAEADNWEPESVDLPKGHNADDGHDHSGHDHSGHKH